ncbi:MAG TPA: 16S rRNA (adenine(1518)-N(6)/adenine(1519)-N(6))-dimethyltransferase RsmA [Candidatus Deferrimicrobiaceae bacterium]
MPRPDSPAEHPGRLLSGLGFSPLKALGQNFLHDRNICRKIVAEAVALGPPFLEIGPGLGALTDLLAETGEPVTAVELDRGLAGWLKGRFEGSNVEIVESDFLKLRGDVFRSRFPRGGTVVGNLPYSVSSPMLLRLVALRDIFPRAVLMLQKELVERLCSPPGCKAYGILSVYMAVLGEARQAFVVRRGCFTPEPDVDSAVFTLRFAPGHSDDFVRALQAVVRTAFAQRRKTLRNAPAGFLPGGTRDWLELLAEASIDPAARAETVPPDRYRRLAEALAGRKLPEISLPSGTTPE